MADQKPIRFLVIGAGITGMAAAHRLQKRLTEMSRPFEIVLTEASGQLGGIIGTQVREGFMMEAGPDCFLVEKPRGTGLCREIGLDRELIETLPSARHAGVVQKGEIYPFPKGFRLVAPTDILSMLMTPVLSLSGKYAMLRDYWCPASKVPDETVGAFVRRRFGPEVLDRLAQPLVAGIYGAEPDQLSLRAAFPAIAEKDKRGSFFKQGLDKKKAATSSSRSQDASLFASFKGGMQTLVQQLGAQMTQVGARLNTSLRMIQGTESGWKAILASGEELEVDGVCLAVSAASIATIVMDMDPELYKLFSKVPYADSVSVHYALKEGDIQKKLEGSGFVVPLSEKKALSACTYVHRKFEGRAPKGHALLRAFSAGRAAATLTKLSDKKIETRLFGELRSLLTIKGGPIFAQTHRYRQALPHYVPGHQERMDAINNHLAALPGLTLAGNWNTGVGVPDCIESGERAADRLISDLCTNF